MRKRREKIRKKKSHLILSDRKAGVIPERHVNSVRVLANIQPNYMCKVRVGSHSSSMNFWWWTLRNRLTAAGWALCVQPSILAANNSLRRRTEKDEIGEDEMSHPKSLRSRDSLLRSSVTFRSTPRSRSEIRRSRLPRHTSLFFFVIRLLFLFLLGVIHYAPCQYQLKTADQRCACDICPSPSDLLHWVSTIPSGSDRITADVKSSPFFMAE